MKVLILGRTRKGSSRCIGGLAEDGTSVRLLSQHGGHWTEESTFRIGSIWEVEYSPAPSLVHPHTEDVRVTSAEYVGNQPELRDEILRRIEPWRGSIDTVFNGALHYTGSDNGYISGGNTPLHSTWFWIPDQDLTLRADGRHYDYPVGYLHRGLSYVGEPQALQTIPAGTLLRVSLARWWKPDGADSDFEERCYLQLSGWF